MSRFIIYLIKGYQILLSPFIGNSCRYTPTCSEYACQALNKYGFFKGLFLGTKRISRCHPWHHGGYDPLP
ncbi:membrane protein insertion efficiency factor YidD [Sulfurirhabdus autotrophica]|uniref:membrane protein insertion efficiency factor YidD n=1 Tax=Sulfurirhabdus autotrophica TaxID=1706046 RepID=UPI000F60B72E|nr:membrane protein insertion efficiency factor YidD [Sulfurirhabdus autotrophica]